MKKFFEEPEVNVSAFAVEDVLTTSGEETTVPSIPVGEGGTPIL